MFDREKYNFFANIYSMKFEDKDYIRIAKDYLIASVAGDDVTFDIFSSRVNETGLVTHPEQICEKGTSITDVIDLLIRSNATRLYIYQEDFPVFKRYIEKSLEAIVDNKELPLEKKSELIYNCAVDVMKDVFDDPRSGENIYRTRSMTDNILKFALGNQLSIPSLLQLGSHDYYTFTHCINVAVFGIGLWQMIFKSKGSEEELREFALGCMLHDIGKTMIEDTVLNKPSKLNENEVELIRQHPELGYEIMKGSVSDVSLDIILHHHERYDGTGYPKKLKGDQISDNAKVAVIADVYDALTTNRPYSGARNPFNAVLLMKDEMVGHFEQDKFVEFINLLGGRRKKM